MNYRYTITLIATLLIFGCSNEADSTHKPEKFAPQEPTEVTPQIEYKVILDDNTSRLKRNIEVVLPERLNKPELEAIAKEINQSATTTHLNTYISYYLYNKSPNSSLWATTYFLGTPKSSGSFTSKLETSINKMTKEEEIKLLTKVSDHNKDKNHIIGSWIIDGDYRLAYCNTLYVDGEKIMLESVFADDAISQTINLQMIESNINGVTRYTPVEEDAESLYLGDYVVINKDNDLEIIYDDDAQVPARELPTFPVSYVARKI